MQTTTAGDCIQLNAEVFLEVDNVDFGFCAGSHMRALATGSRVHARSNYAISGGAQCHMHSANGGYIQTSTRTVTISGTPAFTGGSAPFPAFAIAQLGGKIAARGNTFSGSATGVRYNALGIGAVDVNGASITYLPGDTAGSTSAGGQYY